MQHRRVLAPFIALLERLLPRNKLPLIRRPLLLALNAEPHSDAAAIFPAALYPQLHPAAKRETSSRDGTGEIMLRNLYRYLPSHWKSGSVNGISLFALAWMFLAVPAFGQLGNSGSMEGIVKDPSGSSVAGATVEITNPISGFLVKRLPPRTAVFASRMCPSIRIT